MKEINIGGKWIGGDHPCFLIAEIGINHNGSLSIAKQLFDEAAKAGFDSVKLQTFKVDQLFHQDAGEVNFAGSTYSIREINKKYELKEKWIPELIDYGRRFGLVVFSSVCDEDSADLLEKYDVPAYKFTSTGITHLPLIEHVSKKGKPVIFSTGASVLEEVKEAYSVASKYTQDIVFLHCIVSYPTPLEYSNLLVIKTLKENFPDAIIGFSDHSEHPFKAPVGAIALGAKVIEKHITLDKNMQGPDQFFAIDPNEMKEFVSKVREAEKKLKEKEEIIVEESLLGTSDKKVYDIEEYSKRFSNRSLYASKDLEKGMALTRADFLIVRPGNMAKGLPPSYLSKLLSGEYVLINDILANNPITKEDIKKK